MSGWVADACMELAKFPDGTLKMAGIAYLLVAYNGGTVNVNDNWSIQRWVRDKSGAGTLSRGAVLGVLVYVVVIGGLTTFVTLGSITVEVDPAFKDELALLTPTGRFVLINFKYAAILTYLCLGSVGFRLWQHWVRQRARELGD